MMHLFLPLDRHADDGFGAVGDAFEEAADRLCSFADDAKGFGLNGHLPVHYLYRHAIELFLKSILIVFHRSLRLSDGSGNYNPTPLIPVGGSSKPIYNVHGIKPLFDEMRRIAHAHRDEIARCARTDWSAIPPELETWIAQIETADPRSAVYRYPTSQSPQQDRAKSAFKDIDPSELLERMRSDGPKQIAMVLTDDDGNALESFAWDHDPLPGQLEALKGAAKCLSGAQLGVMTELGRGVDGGVREGAG